MKTLNEGIGSRPRNLPTACTPPAPDNSPGGERNEVPQAF